MENRIKDCQLDLFANRMSAHAYKANQLRLLLAAFAYVLIDGIRRVALKKTTLAKAVPNTIRLKLLKVGAKVINSVRRIKLSLPDACPYKDLFFKAHAALAPPVARKREVVLRLLRDEPVATLHPGTGLAYGLQQHAEQPPAKRRGPKPAISDQALLVAIEADLEASPWEGEGYRKVWARLRVCRDIRVARKRVLRLMRENNLLSPHRCRRRGGNPHDGEIITHAPNLMWGTDGVRVFTVDDGWGWIFTAVEHWNAECVGWHVCKRGDRFAALQPISMGLAGLYGSTAAGAARGLALRMDHGSQYLSDHFTNQIKFWGIQPSYAFVAEPQTNGVAERFNRTLKEQIIHGRIYRNISCGTPSATSSNSTMPSGSSKRTAT